MKFLILAYFILFFSHNGENKLHPVHFSVINMEYIDEKQEFDISFKLFADDFEKIVNKNYNVVLNLGKENQLKNCNNYIDKYIKKNFVVVFDKKAVSKKMIQEKVLVKPEQKSVWLYYKLQNKKPHKVLVRNTLMNDLYNDQKNLFIFTINKFQEAKKFEKNDTDLQFVIK